MGSSRVEDVAQSRPRCVPRLVQLLQ